MFSAANILSLQDWFGVPLSTTSRPGPLTIRPREGSTSRQSGRLRFQVTTVCVWL